MQQSQPSLVVRGKENDARRKRAKVGGDSTERGKNTTKGETKIKGKDDKGRR